MSVPSVLTQAPKEVPAAPSELRRHGRWLLLARVGWGALAAIFVGLYVVSLPLYISFLQTPCVGTACAINGALTPDTARTLHQLGISHGSYVALFVAGSVVQMLVSCGIGGVIAWRRSDDWMALIVALFLISFYIGNAGDVLDLLPLANPAWGLPIRLVHALSSVLTYLFLFLFPHWTLRAALDALGRRGVHPASARRVGASSGVATHLSQLASLVHRSVLCVPYSSRAVRANLPLSAHLHPGTAATDEMGDPGDGRHFWGDTWADYPAADHSGASV